MDILVWEKSSKPKAAGSKGKEKNALKQGWKYIKKFVKPSSKKDSNRSGAQQQAQTDGYDSDDEVANAPAVLYNSSKDISYLEQSSQSAQANYSNSNSTPTAGADSRQRSQPASREASVTGVFEPRDDSLDPANDLPPAFTPGRTSFYASQLWDPNPDANPGYQTDDEYDESAASADEVLLGQGSDMHDGSERFNQVRRYSSQPQLEHLNGLPSKASRQPLRYLRHMALPVPAAVPKASALDDTISEGMEVRPSEDGNNTVPVNMSILQELQAVTSQVVSAAAKPARISEESAAPRVATPTSPDHLANDPNLPDNPDRFFLPDLPPLSMLPRSYPVAVTPSEYGTTPAETPWHNDSRRTSFKLSMDYTNFASRRASRDGIAIMQAGLDAMAGGVTGALGVRAPHRLSMQVNTALTLGTLAEHKPFLETVRSLPLDGVKVSKAEDVEQPTGLTGRRSFGNDKAAEALEAATEGMPADGSSIETFLRQCRPDSSRDPSASQTPFMNSSGQLVAYTSRTSTSSMRDSNTTYPVAPTDMRVVVGAPDALLIHENLFATVASDAAGAIVDDLVDSATNATAPGLPRVASTQLISVASLSLRAAGSAGAAAEVLASGGGDAAAALPVCLQPLASIRNSLALPRLQSVSERNQEDKSHGDTSVISRQEGLTNDGDEADAALVASVDKMVAEILQEAVRLASHAITTFDDVDDVEACVSNMVHSIFTNVVSAASTQTADSASSASVERTLEQVDIEHSQQRATLPEAAVDPHQQSVVAAAVHSAFSAVAARQQLEEEEAHTAASKCDAAAGVDAHSEGVIDQTAQGSDEVFGTQFVECDADSRDVVHQFVQDIFSRVSSVQSHDVVDESSEPRAASDAAATVTPAAINAHYIHDVHADHMSDQDDACVVALVSSVASERRPSDFDKLERQGVVEALPPTADVSAEQQRQQAESDFKDMDMERWTGESAHISQEAAMVAQQLAGTPSPQEPAEQCHNAHDVESISSTQETQKVTAAPVVTLRQLEELLTYRKQLSVIASEVEDVIELLEFASVERLLLSRGASLPDGFLSTPSSIQALTPSSGPVKDLLSQTRSFLMELQDDAAITAGDVNGRLAQAAALTAGLELQLSYNRDLLEYARNENSTMLKHEPPTTRHRRSTDSQDADPAPRDTVGVTHHQQEQQQYQYYDPRRKSFGMHKQLACIMEDEQHQPTQTQASSRCSWEVPHNLRPIPELALSSSNVQAPMTPDALSRSRSTKVSTVLHPPAELKTFLNDLEQLEAMRREGKVVLDGPMDPLEGIQDSPATPAHYDTGLQSSCSGTYEDVCMATPRQPYNRQIGVDALGSAQELSAPGPTTPDQVATRMQHGSSGTPWRAADSKIPTPRAMQLHDNNVHSEATMYAPSRTVLTAPTTSRTYMPAHASSLPAPRRTTAASGAPSPRAAPSSTTTRTPYASIPKAMRDSAPPRTNAGSANTSTATTPRGNATAAAGTTSRWGGPIAPTASAVAHMNRTSSSRSTAKASVAGSRAPSVCGSQATWCTTRTAMSRRTEASTTSARPWR